MSQAISEFIYFKIKPSVQPEDPDNVEGQTLLNVFRNTTHQSGHQSSAWGRTVEDKDVIVWLVNWSDARGSTITEGLKPLLAEAPQGPTSLYTTLSPPICSTDALTTNPVTELCTLAFRNSLSSAEVKQLDRNLINLRTAVVEQLPQSEGPRSWLMGHIDRPSMIRHEKSPTEYAMMHLLAVGWESVETHMKAKETDQFKQNIAPIREKMLPPVPGLEMKHVSFQKV